MEKHEMSNHRAAAILRAALDLLDDGRRFLYPEHAAEFLMAMLKAIELLEKEGF